MKIEHIALYVNDLEKMRTFYETYFQAVSNQKYHNPKTGFQSYFLTFDSGSRLELTTKKFLSPRVSESLGYTHLAIAVGDQADVDRYAQLADASQLSVVTINKLLPELIEKQLLLTTDQPQRTGGRQAAAYQYNAQRTLLLIIQFIEEDQQIVIRFSVVDLVGNILHHEQSAEGRLPQFLQVIRQIKQEYPKISLAVVGIPGVEIDLNGWLL